MNVQIQFALKLLNMRIKISSLAIVITEFDVIGEYNYGVVMQVREMRQNWIMLQ